VTDDLSSHAAPESPSQPQRGFFDLFVDVFTNNWRVLGGLFALDAGLQVLNHFVMMPWIKTVEGMADTTDPEKIWETMGEFLSQVSISFVPSMIVAGFAYFGTLVVTYQYLKSDENPEEWFGHTIRRYLPTLVMSIMVTFLIALGFAFLALPGMALMFLALYSANFCLNKNTGPWTSFKSSLSLGWKFKGRTFMLWAIVMGIALSSGLMQGGLSIFLPMDLQWVFSFSTSAFSRIIGVVVTIVFMDLMDELPK
jgi:hypothetical protein